MAKIKVIFQVQGQETDIEDAEWTLDNVIEEIIDEDKIEDTRQKIIQSLKDKTEFRKYQYDKDKNYSVEDILWFDLKGNEVYRNEDSFHSEFWEYMENNGLGVDDRLTREE
tara:strand:+ start:604 stop:936 length:333 start_codon:yes stop_codon:yes gene_type:complete